MGRNAMIIILVVWDAFQVGWAILWMEQRYSGEDAKRAKE